MTTFEERKAARIAAGQRTFRFNVIAGFPFEGELVQGFDSRGEAEDFAFKQISPFVGDTKARRLMCERHKNVHISTGLTFSVRRKQVIGNDCANETHVATSR